MTSLKTLLQQDLSVSTTLDDIVVTIDNKVEVSRRTIIMKLVVVRSGIEREFLRVFVAVQVFWNLHTTRFAQVFCSTKIWRTIIKQTRRLRLPFYFSRGLN